MSKVKTTIKTTAATLALTKAGIKFTPYPYDYDPSADKIGMSAAAAIGKPPEQVFKTLMTIVDKTNVCVVVPSNKEVSMKKLAAVFGGKHAEMMKPADAERNTGFKVGGISPFGQRKQTITFFDATIENFDEAIINGGLRGLLIGLSPKDAILATNGTAAQITH